jgi:hypothetical protein
MYEVIAIGLGIALGAAFARVHPARRALAFMVPLAILGGAAVTAASGELEVSIGFLVFDTLQTTVAAVATYALVTVWQTRAAR